MAIDEKQYAGFWETLTGSAQGGGADKGVVGGTCTDHKGLLGTVGAKVSCAELRAAQEGKPAGTYTSYTAVPDAPSSQRALAAGISTGNYAESGYVYHYNAQTKAVAIVMSPKGGTNIPVTKGSKAYDAIIAAIKSKKAKPVASARVKADRATKSSVPASVSQREIVEEAVATLPPADPFYKKPWFLVGAPLTVAALIGMVVFFWPSVR